MVAQREAWLKLTTEEAIEPWLPICDPHHHLFVRPTNQYLLEDLLHDIGGGHNITHTVFVDSQSMYRKDGPVAMQPVGETEYIRSLSGLHGNTFVAAGIVGYVDFRFGSAVEPVLEAHMAAGKNRFRGIRQMAAWDADPNTSPSIDVPNLLLDKKFREGFSCLQKHGLSFEAWVFHTQLMELVDLARAFPETTIILNHIGGPLGTGPFVGKRAEVFPVWQHDMRIVEKLPNVVVKVGGLGMPRCGFGWREQAKPPNSAELAKAMSPYYLWVIELFGVNRCMFESNFPADKPSYSYTVMWNAFKRITRNFSPSERAALFQDNAVRVYRLGSDR